MSNKQPLMQVRLRNGFSDRNRIKEENEIIKTEIAKTSLIENDYVFNTNFDSHKYYIVFGIVSKTGDIKPKISFFSKLNFVLTFKYLENIGFECKITGIEDLYEKSNKDKLWAKQ